MCQYPRSSRQALRVRLPQHVATPQCLEVLELIRTYPLQAVAGAVERTLAAGSLGVDTVTFFLRANGNVAQGRSTGVLVEATANSLWPDY